MSLLEQIKADQLTARKARDTVAASLLTTLIGEASSVSEEEFAAAQAGKATNPDEKTLATVTKFLKNAKSTRDLMAKDPAHAEKLAVTDREITILSGYLPQQMTQEQLQVAINLFRQGEPDANMGAVMAHLKANYAGLYDGKMASQLAK